MKKIILPAFFLIGAIGIGLFLAWDYLPHPDVSEVGIEEAKTLIEEGVIVVDVRTPKECKGIGMIEGAINIPIDELQDRMLELEDYKEDQVLTICAAGVRSRRAARILVQQGFKGVGNVTEGMNGWIRKGYKVKRGFQPE